MILGAEPKNQVIWTIRCKVMHIWAYLQIWGHNFATDSPNDLFFFTPLLKSKFMATLFSRTIDFDQPFERK